MSLIMGLFPPDVVDRMKARNIRWFASATTVAEALQAEAAGADAIIAQGSEAGGHRRAFYADRASAQICGLMALVPAVCEAVCVPAGEIVRSLWAEARAALVQQSASREKHCEWKQDVSPQ